MKEKKNYKALFRNTMSLTFIAALFFGFCGKVEAGAQKANEGKPVAAVPGKIAMPFDTLQEIHVMREENASQVIRNDSLVNQWLEKKQNIKIVIEAVPAASYEEKKKVLISTNNMPDVMKVSMSDVRQYAAEDMFVNLNDNRDKLLNFFAVYAKDPNLSKLSVNKVMYSFPVLRYASFYDGHDGQLPIIRTDLLKKHNLAIPKSFDELYNVLSVLKQNYPDKIPLVNRKGGSTSGTQKLLETMAYPLGSGYSPSIGVYYDLDVDGGRYIYGPAHENFKVVLKDLNRFYNARLLDQDYATNTVDLWKEKMSSGKGLMYFDNSGFRYDFEAALRSIEPDARYNVIPTMTNSLGQTRNTIYDFNWPAQHYVVATSSKKIDVALAYFNWAYSEEGVKTKGYGILGETYEIVDGKPAIKTEILDQYIKSGVNSPSYELQSRIGVGLLDFTPYVDIGAGEMVKRRQQSPEDLQRLLDTETMCVNDKGLRNPNYDPPLTPEEARRANTLRVAVENVVLPEIDKYIMGIEPIEKYDTVIQRARSAGATELEEIYNKANATYK
jgi:ABC-type glycerol-3-phosphate transport system substrate-binding protein